MTGVGPVRRTDCQRCGCATLELLYKFFVLVLALFWIFPASASGLCPMPGLSAFYQSLDDLRSGKRTRPVTVLHLGDSHIALDHLTGVLRDNWQQKFGYAGRGFPAGVPYKYYSPQGFSISMDAGWKSISSLKTSASGPFGMSGFRVETSEPGAQMELTGEHAIEIVEIEAYGGPDTGAVLLTLGDAAPLRLSTRSKMNDVVFLRVPAAAVHKVRLQAAGDGPVVLLGWTILSSLKAQPPGVRYDSYGIIGATLNVIENWNGTIVDAEIRRLAPDLVILGYGTNEGFNDGIDLDDYGHLFETFIHRLERLAPQASILALGAFDAARPAKDKEKMNCGDGYAVPPNLDALRHVQRNIVLKNNHAFIDGARAMGGTCSIEEWVNASPPLAWPDHVHLRPSGARLAGQAIWEGIMGPYEMQACRPRL